MPQEKLESQSQLLFHGTTRGYFDRITHERGEYLVTPKVYLSPSFNYALSYALERSADYKDKGPTILAVDKADLVGCNLLGPFSPQSVPYYTCEFLKPEWLKSYDYPQDNRKISEKDRQILRKIADDFPVLFSRSWGKYIFL